MAVKLGVTIALEAAGGAAKAFTEAAKAAERLKDQANAVRAGWAQTITAMSTGFLALKSIIGPLEGMLKKPVEMALEQERASLRMATALRVTHQYTEDAHKSLDNYADTLELATGKASELTSNVMAQNIVYGMNTRQVKIAAEAASKLAAVNGGDLASANEMLIQSTNNQIRGLVKLVPEVAKLTEAQRRHGDAITLVNDKLANMTNKTTADASTAIERAGVLWDSFTKALGRSILGGVDWEAAYTRVEQIMRRVGDSLGANTDQWGKLGNWFVNKGLDIFDKLAFVFQELSPRMDLLTSKLERLYGFAVVMAVPWLELAVAIESVWDAISGDTDAEARMDALGAALKTTFQGGMESMTGFRDGLQKTGVAVDDLRVKASDPIQIAFDTNAEEQLTKLRESLDQRGWYQKLNDSYSDMAKEQLERQTEYTRKETERQKGFWKGVGETIKSALAMTPKFLGGDQIRKSMGVNPPANTFGPPASLKPIASGATVGELKAQDEAALRQMADAAGKFSEKALTVDPELMQKRRAALDQIAAMEQAGQSDLERQRITSLNAIRKIETDAAKVGIADAMAFANARKKIADTYVFQERANGRIIIELTGDENEKRKAAHEATWDALQQAQEKAGAKSFKDLEKQANQRMELIKKEMKDELAAQRALQEEVADMTGSSYAKDEIEYQKHLDRLEELHKLGAFGPDTVNPDTGVSSNPMMEQSRGEVDQQRDREKRQTSATIVNAVSDTPMDPNQLQKFDNSIKDASHLVDQAQSGLTGILNGIGALFGPLGMFIAQIINMLRMPPEQFKAMIDAIMDDMIDMIPHIMENIPTIFERILLAIPDVIASIIGTLFSVPMWVRFLVRIAHAFGDLLQGVFSMLFLGKSLRKSVLQDEAEKDAKNKQVAQPKVEFGSAKADAGDNKFKIKDATGGEKARDLSEVEDTLPDVAEESGKTFGQYLLQGFKDLGALIAQFAKDLVKGIADFFNDPLAVLRKWFYEISKFFKALFKDWNPFTDINAAGMIDVNALARKIGEAFEKAFPGLAQGIKNAIKDAWDAVIAGLKAFLDDPFAALKNIADTFLAFLKDPLQVLGDIANKIGAFLTDHFPFLKPLVEDLKAFAADPLGALTVAAADLKTVMLSKWPWLKPIADKLGAFQRAKHEYLSGLADRLMAFTKTNFPFLEHAASVLATCLVDPIQSLKDAVAYTEERFMAAADYFGDRITVAAENFWGKIYAAADYFYVRLEAVVNFFMATVNGAADYFHEKVAAVGQFFYDTTGLSADTFKAKVTEVALAFKEGVRLAGEAFKPVIAEAATTLKTAMSNGAETVKTKITELLDSPKFGAAGLKLFNGFWDKLVEKWDKFEGLGKNLWLGFWNALVEKWDKFTTMGANIKAGLWSGIVEIWDKFYDMGKNIAKGFKDALPDTSKGDPSSWKLNRGGFVTDDMSSPRTAAVWKSMGAQQLAEGGTVLGSGSITDTVPIVATPGETMLSRAQTRALQEPAAPAVNLNITFNVAAGANVDKEAVKKMGEQVIDYVRRESKNGRNILRPSGVY